MYVLVGVEFIRILAILQKMCFETKRKVDKQAGAELGQAKLKLGLGFTSTNFITLACLILLVE